MNTTGFDGPQIAALKTAFASASAKIFTAWLALYDDNTWNEYQKAAGKTSQIAKWLATGENRKTYADLLWNVVDKLVHGHEFFLTFDGAVMTKFASVTFNGFNVPSKDITFYPPFFSLKLDGLLTSGQEGVVCHELGRIVNSMSLDGKAPPSGSSSKSNVDAWDWVIYSIVQNLPSKYQIPVREKK